MFEIWVPITILAAFSQNIRSAFQKSLQNKLSDMGATYVRFSYGLPFVFLYFIILNNNSNNQVLLNDVNFNFFIFCSLGGICQILATFLLLKIFLSSNFAVGTAYSKTEPIQAAFFSLIILHEAISFIGIIGIVIGLIGVFIISYRSHSIKYLFLNYSIILGLLSGTFFGISAVCFRGASLSLNNPEPILSSSFTLLVAISLQTLIVSIYLLIFDKKQFILTVKNYQESITVGFFGAFASLCWFYAMTVKNVAYVRALGQIELIFTILIATLYFKEKLLFNQFVGIIITFIGLLLILLGS